MKRWAPIARRNHRRKDVDFVAHPLEHRACAPNDAEVHLPFGRPSPSCSVVPKAGELPGRFVRSPVARLQRDPHRSFGRFPVGGRWDGTGVAVATPTPAPEVSSGGGRRRDRLLRELLGLGRFSRARAFRLVGPDRVHPSPPRQPLREYSYGGAFGRGDGRRIFRPDLKTERPQRRGTRAHANKPNQSHNPLPMMRAPARRFT